MSEDEPGTWQHYQGRFTADARRITDKLSGRTHDDPLCDDYRHGPESCAGMCHEPQRATEQDQ